MSVRPYREIQRRKCRQISVGKVKVGGDAPITVQSMTNALTTDVDGNRSARFMRWKKQARISSAFRARMKNRRSH